VFRADDPRFFPDERVFFRFGACRMAAAGPIQSRVLAVQHRRTSAKELASAWFVMARSAI
jgi:hypothetical protein